MKTRHLFPVRQTNTITRKNIRNVLEKFPKLETDFDIAMHIIGCRYDGSVKPRHIRRVQDLRQAK